MAGFHGVNAVEEVKDTVAGVEHLGRGSAEDVDTLLVVVEPYDESVETGRRTKDLAADLGVECVFVPWVEARITK